MTYEYVDSKSGSEVLTPEGYLPLGSQEPEEVTGVMPPKRRGRPKGSQNRRPPTSPLPETRSPNHSQNGGSVPSESDEDLPDEKIRQILRRESRDRYKRLLNFYGGIGLTLYGLNPQDGMILIGFPVDPETGKQSKENNCMRLAKSVADYCEANDGFADFVDTVLPHTALGAMLSLHASIVMAIGANHGVLPKDMWGATFGRVARLFRPATPSAAPSGGVVG